jgi:hypothetical protein
MTPVLEKFHHIFISPFIILLLLWQISSFILCDHLFGKLKPGEHYLQLQKRNILHEVSAKLTINLDKNMWVTYWPPELMDFTCYRSISVFTRQRNISYHSILFIKMKISKLMNYTTDMCQSWWGATAIQYKESLRPNLQYPTHPLKPVTVPSLVYIFVKLGSFCCVIG